MRPLPILFNLVTVAAGTAAGVWLRPDALAAAPLTAEATHTPGEAGTGRLLETDLHPGGVVKTQAPTEDTIVIQFSRPFVVSVADDWRAQSLIVLSLGVEVDRRTSETATGLEAKLRDRITATLVRLAGEGGLDDRETDPLMLDRVKTELRGALEPVLPGGAHDVVVTEIRKRAV
ncbi:hypothetical protein [Parvularcula dongshanensis]|uniref:Flagellar protein FliL n=1 Tax=Parvularcula dongshanensis TaxID=1173995 RepID=A0A840I7Q6_9PROT|nr:hypothetical protein [Parvularcula dongshanensis]MBB4660311.1 hypothetical protein [Parvularcula dongshanensis]